MQPFLKCKQVAAVVHSVTLPAPVRQVNSTSSTPPVKTAVVCRYVTVLLVVLLVQHVAAVAATLLL